MTKYSGGVIHNLVVCLQQHIGQAVIFHSVDFYQSNMWQNKMKETHIIMLEFLGKALYNYINTISIYHYEQIVHFTKLFIA